MKNYSYIKLNQELNNEYSTFVNNAFEQTESKQTSHERDSTNIINEPEIITNLKDDDLEMNRINKSTKAEDLKKNDSNDRSKIPKKAVLSWQSVTIKADTRTTFQKVFSCNKAKPTTILNDIKGIVKPFEMLALMGPR